MRQRAGGVQRVHSYVTGDKMSSVCNAAGEDVVREHARRGAPAESLARVVTVTDPTAAEA